MSATAVATRQAHDASRSATGEEAALGSLDCTVLPGSARSSATVGTTTRRTGSGAAPATSPSRRLRPGTPARKRRPGERPGRGVSPSPRSTTSWSTGPVTAAPALLARGCTVDLAPTVPPATARVHTRLTDRGIAVILVAGVMLVVAAVTVVGLTAFRVTGDSAEPLPSAPFVQTVSAQP